MFDFKIDLFVEGRLPKKKSVDINNSLNLKKMQGSLQMIRAKQSTNGFAMAMSKENQNVQNTMLSGLLTFRKKS